MATPNNANFTKLDIVNKFAIEYGDATSVDTLDLLKTWFDEALWDLTTELELKHINAVTTKIVPENSYAIKLDWGQSRLISVLDLTNMISLEEHSFEEVMSALNSGSDIGTAGPSESETGATTNFINEQPNNDPETRFVLVEIPILIGAVEKLLEGIPDWYAYASIYLPEASPVQYLRYILFNRKTTFDALYRIEYMIGEGDDIPDTVEFFYPVQAIPILMEKLRILAYRHEGETDKLQAAFLEVQRKLNAFRESFANKARVQFGSESRKVLQSRETFPVNNYVITSLD